MKISDYEPLTEEVEAELTARLPDEEATQALVMGSMQNGVKYLSRVSKGGKTEEELISLCYAALCKAVRNLKPGKGRLFAYAKIYLRGALFSTWKRSSVIRGVSYREMTDFETFQREKMYQKTKARSCSESGEAQAEFETAGHPAQEFEFDAIESRESGALAADVVKRVCSDHEKIVIQLRFNLDYSFEQISKFLGVTRSAAQSSCERALRKIRVAMTAEGTLR